MRPLLLQGCNWDPPSSAPRIIARDVLVLGIGHLAAALRIELARRGFGREQPSAAPPLLVACSDFENLPSFRDVSRRAIEQRSPILFACIAGPHLRIGPWVTAGEEACFDCFHTYEPPQAYAAVGVVWHPRLLARLGAVLVTGEVAGCLASEPAVAQ